MGKRILLSQCVSKTLPTEKIALNAMRYKKEFEKTRSNYFPFWWDELSSSPQQHISCSPSALLVEFWVRVAAFSRCPGSYSPASGVCDFPVAYPSISFSSCIFLLLIHVTFLLFSSNIAFVYLSLAFHQLENETHRPIYILQADFAATWAGQYNIFIGFLNSRGYDKICMKILLL